MKKLKKFLMPLLIVVVLAGGGFTYFALRGPSAQPALAAPETASLETGDLNVVISAVGKVRTNQTTSLSFGTTGTVSEVNVAVGDTVKAGDTLAALEQTSLPQSVILAQADLADAQKALDDLATEADQSRVKAMQDIVTYEEAVRDAQYTLDNFTIPSNMAQYDAVEGIAAMKAILDKARVAFEPYKYLSSGDQEREERLETLNEAQADYNTAVKRLQYEYDLEVAQANLDKARKDYETWKDGPQDADVKAAEAKVAAAEATLAKDHIEAPFAGIITAAAVKVGDQITEETRDTVAFRMDDLNSLYVDLDVSEVDINQVKEGQAATLVFDAISGKTYHGQVTEVAWTGVSNSNVVNYNVTVRLDDADDAVRPGMTAEVDITTADLQDILLVPNQAIQMENDQTVVYVMKPDGQLASVPVTLGLANETYTQVAGGDLKVGDAVVLNPAEDSQDQQGMGLFGMRGPGAGGPPPGDQQNGGSQGGQP